MTRDGISRRSASRLMLASMFSSAMPWRGALGLGEAGAPGGLSAEDDAFLDEFERAGCLYFMEQAGPATGQVLDRAINKGTGALDPRRAASIAATGFGLTALCIAHKRGYLPGEQVRERVRTTLEFHWSKLRHERGFFYHFNDVETGAVLWNSEVSSIDTSILLCGILTCRAYFGGKGDAAIRELATRIYERVDWPWMLNGGMTFSMGWHPGTGFLAARWSYYCELMMIYLLAIGSPTHPVPASTWSAWTRPQMQFGPYRYIAAADPLFVHQYSHAWFDFRGKRDGFANYFENSVTATEADKLFLLGLKLGYDDDYWGVSASDSQNGYTAWGGPPMLGHVDGTVVPCATAGSLAFLPGPCLRVLRSLKQRYGREAWGRYGLCDAFHPAKSWYDADVLGIDLGISVLMAENLRSGFVWETFMRNPEATSAMRACGFRRA